MERTVRPTGQGYVATDGNTYGTEAALLAAGKTAFPGYESVGLYPASVFAVSLSSAGNVAGDYFEIAFNTTDLNVPTRGLPVLSGQQLVESGFTPVSRQLLSNCYVLNKKTSGDIIALTAIYE